MEIFCMEIFYQSPNQSPNQSPPNDAALDDYNMDIISVNIESAEGELIKESVFGEN